jgi:hypothetical protein
MSVASVAVLARVHDEVRVVVDETAKYERLKS